MRPSITHRYTFRREAKVLIAYLDTDGQIVCVDPVTGEEVGRYEPDAGGLSGDGELSQTRLDAIAAELREQGIIPPK